MSRGAFPRDVTGPTLTIGRRPPKPHAEAPLARQTALVAFAFFLASALALAWYGVDLSTLSRTFPLYALGGFSTLIFGTSRLLVSGMAGRDMVGGSTSALFTLVPSTVGAAGLFVADGASVGVRSGLAILWGIGAFTHVFTILASTRRAPTRPPLAGADASRSARAAMRALEASAVGYAAASAVLIPLAYAGRITLASGVHAVLVGFVISTIMATAAHILPRFTRTPAPGALLVVLAPLTLAGPALMIAGLNSARAVLRAGALIEGLAFAVFGATVVVMLARAHRFRLVNLAYGAAPAAIALGGLVALHYALTGAHADKLAAHGLLNAFGFVGLFVIGASTDLYGPALDVGAKPAKRHAVVAVALTLGGLVLAGAATMLAAATLARAGMLVYASGVAWQLAGIAASHRRAGRVLARFSQAPR